MLGKSGQLHTGKSDILQACAYAAEDGILTEKMIDERVADAIKGHAKKSVWETDQQAVSYKATAGTS